MKDLSVLIFYIYTTYWVSSMVALRLIAQLRRSLGSLGTSAWFS